MSTLPHHTDRACEQRKPSGSPWPSPCRIQPSCAGPRASRRPPGPGWTAGCTPRRGPAGRRPGGTCGRAACTPAWFRARFPTPVSPVGRRSSPPPRTRPTAPRPRRRSDRPSTGPAQIEPGSGRRPGGLGSTEEGGRSETGRFRARLCHSKPWLQISGFLAPVWWPDLLTAKNKKIKKIQKTVFFPKKRNPFFLTFSGKENFGCLRFRSFDQILGFLGWFGRIRKLGVGLVVVVDEDWGWTVAIKAVSMVFFFPFFLFFLTFHFFPSLFSNPIFFYSFALFHVLRCSTFTETRPKKVLSTSPSMYINY